MSRCGSSRGARPCRSPSRRGTPRGGGRGWGGAGPAVGEDLVDQRRLRDEGDDAHHAVAGRAREGVDLALNDHYAKDSRWVYYCDDYRDGKEYFMIKHDRVVKLANADAPSFRLLDDYYARDSATVYFNGVMFLVGDNASFGVLSDLYAGEILEFVYAKNATHVYYMSELLTGADAATFKVALIARRDVDADSMRRTRFP